MPLNSLIDILHDKSEIKKCDETLIIKETDNHGKRDSLEKVTIINLNDVQICSHKLDLYNPISPHLKKKNGKGINKGVDAFAIFNNENKKYILFFELKSTTFKTGEVANKFFASTAFVHHLDLLLEKFYDCSFSNYKAAAILFCVRQKSGRIKKVKMRPDNLEYRAKIYENSIGKTIQVLEIEKETASNFKVSINKIFEKSRCKHFKNWP